VVEETALEAAKAAVAPHLIYEKSLLENVRTMTISRNWWRVGTFAALGTGILGVILVAVLK
jgi:hypothetical protein